jgi:hypothetical protein
MCDQDVRAFVRCLSPSKFDVGSDERPQEPGVGVTFLLSPKSDGPVADVAASSLGGRGFGAEIVIGARARGAGAKSHAVDRVKLLIYQQLVEGLKKVAMGGGAEEGSDGWGWRIGFGGKGH